MFPTFQRKAHLAEMRSLPELLTEFAEVRAANLVQLQALNLTPQDLQRCGRHLALRMVTLSQLLATWPAHDLSHLHQISRTLALDYCEAVVPWSRYLGVLQCHGHSEQS